VREKVFRCFHNRILPLFSGSLKGFQAA